MLTSICSIIKAPFSMCSSAFQVPAGPAVPQSRKQHVANLTHINNAVV